MTLPEIATLVGPPATLPALLEEEKALTTSTIGSNLRLRGRRQLIVYHFMFHPDWEARCAAGASVP